MAATRPCGNRPPPDARDPWRRGRLNRIRVGARAALRGAVLPDPDLDSLLVLGAASLIGRRLPAHMPGQALLGVGRRGAEAAPAGYGWTTADLRDPALVFPRAGAAVSLAPIWLLPGALPALARAGVRRIVASSSTSRWTKAASPDTAEREVARRLAEGEAALTAFAEREGIGWTVLRPTLIYAEGEDQNVSRLAALARRWGVLPLSGSGAGRRQPVHADDLAAAVPLALASEAARDRAYDLPGGETLTYARMGERVFAGLGRPARLLHVPPPLWRVGLALARPLLPGASAAMGARMAEDLVFDPTPAERDFGWRPRAFHPTFR